MITLWHVVEHLSAPETTLAELWTRLKPGGTMVFATPNMACAGVAKCAPTWPWNQPPPVHLWHFSPSGIRRLVTQLLPSADVLVTTRDAWDCNHLMDAGIRPKVIDRLGLPPRARLRLDSVLRLGSCVVNEALLNPLWHRRRASGTEIVAQISKSRLDQGGPG